MTHATCKLTAKNRDQLRNPTLGNRVWATFTFLMYIDAAKSSRSGAYSSAATGSIMLVFLCPNSTRLAQPDFVAGRVWSCRFHYMDRTGPDRTCPRLQPVLRQSLARITTTRTHGLVCDPTRADPRTQSVDVEIERTKTRQSRRTCRRLKRSVGLVRSGPCSGT